MTLAEFTASLSSSAPPPDLSPALLALWHDGRGSWDTAHSVAQEIAGDTGAWVHAYLHRKEGDRSNAAYWYRAAGKPVCTDSLTEEWTTIVLSLSSAIV